MLFIRILNYLRGYITIEGTGYFLERFINICLRRDILLWDIKKPGEQKMMAKMSIQAFREIRPVAKRTKTRLHITSRHGLPFLLHRYRKRKLAVLGVVILLVLLWYTSSHVMGITIYGNTRIDTETVKSQLAEFGLRPGEPLKDINQKLIQNQMISALDDIAWIGINRSGSRVYVEVVERIDPEKRIDAGSPCDLVAEKDGVIEKLEIRGGQTMVKVGEGVREGDVLVSGIVDNSAVGFRYVHSFGDVYAATRYKKSREYPLEYQEKTYTGSQKSRYGLQVLNWNLNLFLNGRQPYSECERSEIVKEYNPPVDILPSVYVKQYIYREQNSMDKTRTEEEALQLGTDELTAEIMGELPEDATVKRKSVSHIRTEFKSVVVTVEIECSENIAKEITIDKNDAVDYDSSKENTEENSTNDTN